MSRQLSEVVLASAGTGKTHELTGRLLRLFAAGVAPERVLASTFTRKAAGEILQRVVHRLCQATASEEAARRLGEQIHVPLRREEAVALTCRLLRGIDRLRFSTLDAWFLESVQHASFQLGLPPEWELADEAFERRTSAAALSQSLERARTPELWSTLITDLRRGGADARVHAGLLAELDQASAYLRESDAAAWEFPEWIPSVPAEEFDEARRQLGCTSAPPTRTGKPHASFQNQLLALCGVLERRDWARFAESGLVQNVLAGGDKYYGLTIPDDLARWIRTFVQQAAADLAPLVRLQNRAMHVLTSDYVEELDRARLRERRLPFEALPRLAERAAKEAVGLVHGEGIRHLLLDEFQDTSSPQWHALEPFLERVLADEAGSFFCVGDVKQSIYGWRKAEPRLFLQLPERLGLPSRQLHENYRSSQAVLDVVNRVFSTLAVNPRLHDPAAQLAGARFQATFVDHAAHDPTIPGRVRLWTTETVPDGGGLAEPAGLRIARGVQLAQELLQDDPDRSVAFLLRRKGMMAPLLEALKRARLPATGVGGNPLTDSSAVNFALSMLEFADHPRDDNLHFHLATSPFAGQLGMAVSDGSEARTRVARQLRRRWIEIGPAAMLAELEPTVRAQFSEFEVRRYASLIELALRCGPDAGLRPAQLAARLAHERVPDTRSAAIQVMTVHGAKGLEFDAVILIDLDSSLSKRGNAIVGHRRGDDPAAPYDVVTHVLNAKQNKLIRSLEEVREGEHSARIQEELSILYVALTRAVNRLELVVDPSPSGKERTTFAGLLLHAFGVIHADADSLLFEHVHGSVDRAPEAPSEVRPAPAPERPAPRIALAPARGAWQRVAPSRIAALSEPATEERRSSAELFRATGAARARGRLWHAWIERLAWIEDGLPELDALVAQAEGLCSETALARLEARAFLEALGRAEIRGEVSRAGAAERLGAANEELELLREQRFALARTHAGGREILQGAFDRAVVARGLRRAEIVDFKTDAFGLGGDLADIEARARQYLPQMLAYREALAQSTGIPLENITMRLCFLGAGRTVCLTGEDS